ncbi:hypothetical protein BESB_017160 [Besnoitia besnoiti]|uniref:phosphoethanolamine N-methyltransferase n=1 Tax=Besnoitia besnoiti TaxID=94643 RepID=A0A2A9M1M7_BESBE|nr:hypothetical protein BESB_017160 [Besnoitia besnoiti]PFH32398.1 hypothetical protein BESB_017160 [Besnoitia besnoiti]
MEHQIGVSLQDDEEGTVTPSLLLQSYRPSSDGPKITDSKHWSSGSAGQRRGHDDRYQDAGSPCPKEHPQCFRSEVACSKVKSFFPQSWPSNSALQSESESRLPAILPGTTKEDLSEGIKEPVGIPGIHAFAEKEKGVLRRKGCVEGITVPKGAAPGVEDRLAENVALERLSTIEEEHALEFSPEKPYGGAEGTRGRRGCDRVKRSANMFQRQPNDDISANSSEMLPTRAAEAAALNGQAPRGLHFVNADIDAFCGRSSEEAQESTREKFREYWQCALNNFGLTNEGMLLKQDAGEQGFSTADAQEVVNLVVRYAVAARLGKVYSSSHSSGYHVSHLWKPQSDATPGGSEAQTADSCANCSGYKDVPHKEASRVPADVRPHLSPSPKRRSQTTTHESHAHDYTGAKLRPWPRRAAEVRLMQSLTSPMQNRVEEGMENDTSGLSAEDAGDRYMNGTTLLGDLPDNVFRTVPRFETVLELGAGIGRLTRLLQRLADQVVALDFVDEYVRANRDANSDPNARPNDLFVTADATTVEFPLAADDPRIVTARPSSNAASPATFDLLVINWLLMYLTDYEAKALLWKLISVWSRRGGFIFVRESCGEPSDKGKQNRDWAIGGNPTVYRCAEVYSQWMHEIAQATGEIEKQVSVEPCQTPTDTARTH